jgi:Icc protein
MSPDSTRREFSLGIGVAAGGLTACDSAPESSSNSRPGASPRLAGRPAHMTDFHEAPRGAAPGGMARALRHAMSAQPGPDLRVNTGDSIMDGLEASDDWAAAHWRLFKEVLAAERDIPSYPCIGNHDVWGWGLGDSAGLTGPLYGKAVAVQQLGLSHRCYAFERGGWRFIALDSTLTPILDTSPIPYPGMLDTEPLTWLETELARAPSGQPVCGLSHIPLLCACAFFGGDNEVSGNWMVPGAWMHVDARRLKSLFTRYPGVCLCLSGHAHQHDRVDDLGFPPADVLVDLYENGSSDHTSVPYDRV